MQFQFRCAGQLLFGRGEHRRAAGLAAGLGRRVFLVTGAASLAKSGVLASLTASLAERAEHIEHVTVSAEPTVDQADSLAKQCQAAGCQVVLAVGGGSVLDVGKAVAALATNAGAGIDYLEDVGRGTPRALAEVPLPVVAVPTTAGSGSEVTRNSVLKVPELQVKRSLRSDLMIPKVAIVDPDLLTTAPQRVAASAGMDALTHLIEGYLSTGAQPLTDALALRGIRLLWQALHRLADCFRGRLASLHPDMYEQLALTSLWGGIVLANAGLGAVHGLVAPLGGLCNVAHGDGCACLLPATFRVNAQALLSRQPQSPARARLAEIVQLLTEGSDDVDAAVERLASLRKELGILGLADQGARQRQFEQVVRQARGGSMRSNPIVLTDEELHLILESSLSS
ncbi:MAG: iron-containing alcohol dehydrogenase [Myxococcales bacterium]|nr:iron-containing alcohol dehydrogenase [Myxococcales bacterium]